MRTIRSIRRRVAKESRDEYLRIMAERGELFAALREAGIAKGFYVMESGEEAGMFWEFIECADAAAAAAFDARSRSLPDWAANEEKLEALGTSILEDSLWRQRV